MIDEREVAPPAPGPEEERLPTGAELLEPPFAHPPWALGMVLVIAVPFLIWGLFAHPVWLLIGAPFLAVLAVWVGVRVVQWRRGPQAAARRDESS